MTITRQPSGGRWAIISGRGSAWIESVDTIKGTAKVRFRGKFSCESIALGLIDFNTER